jgi:hypothetical protein
VKVQVHRAGTIGTGTPASKFEKQRQMNLLPSVPGPWDETIPAEAITKFRTVCPLSVVSFEAWELILSHIMKN